MADSGDFPPLAPTQGPPRRSARTHPPNTSPLATSKRQRVTPDSNPGDSFNTPYTSTISGAAFQFHYRDVRNYSFFLVSSANAVQMPSYTAQYLMEESFSLSLTTPDALTFGNELILCLQPDPNNEQALDFFLSCATKIPTSNCVLHLKEINMAHHLQAYLNSTGQPDRIRDQRRATRLQSVTDSDASDRSRRPSKAEPTVGMHTEDPPVPPTKLPAEPPTMDPPVLPAQQPAEPLTEDPSVLPTQQPSEPPTLQPTATIQHPRRKFLYTKVNFNDLDVPAPAQQPGITILYRPTIQGDSLHKLNPLKLAKQLESGSFRNIRNGGLAADYAANHDVTDLLLTTEIQDIAVSASFPASSSSCTGVVHGVHWEISEADFLAAAQPSPSGTILTAKRLAKPGQRSWTLKLTFKGTTLPNKVLLVGQAHKVRAYKPILVQCYKCGGYSHIAKTCTGTNSCWTCAQDHDTATCPNASTPSCCQCGGPHAANDPSCPARGFQAKVAQVRVRHNLSFQTARTSVHNAAKSYAAAAATTTSDDQPNLQPLFKHNVAHPRPSQAPIPAHLLANLFHGLVALLVGAASSNDYSNIINNLTVLFQSIVPDLNTSPPASN